MQLWEELGRWRSGNGSQIKEGKSPRSARSPAWVAKPELPHQVLALEELMVGPLGNCCPWAPTALCLIVALGPLLGMEACSQEEELNAEQRGQRANLASDQDHIWLCLHFYSCIPNFCTGSFILSTVPGTIQRRLFWGSIVCILNQLDTVQHSKIITQIKSTQIFGIRVILSWRRVKNSRCR